MDGDVKQEEMAARIKREVKENGPRRGERRSINQALQSSVVAKESITEKSNLDPASHGQATALVSGIILPLPEVPTVEIGSLFRSPPANAKAQQNYNEDPFPKDECIMSPVGWSNNVLLMFYLDNVVPFLFPLYRPSLHRDGGRAWILEMVYKSPAIRQAILCQASVFYSLTLGTEDLYAVWETILKHTGDAFAMLRQALQYRLENPIPSTPHCTVRIIAAIMQLQRFEIATLSFENCRTHLTAALDLFQRLLTSHIATEQTAPKAIFNAMLQALRPSENGFTAHPTHVSSSEQAAFRFTTALLIVDDILASTVLQQSPRLYEYHEGILGDCDSTDSVMNLDNINGCQNWVFAELGKTAVLDAWKQRCKKDGNLDVIELAHRAIPIRDSLQNRLSRLSTDPYAIPEPSRAMMDLLTADYLERTLRSVGQVSIVTRVVSISQHTVVVWDSTKHMDYLVGTCNDDISPYSGVWMAVC